MTDVSTEDKMFSPAEPSRPESKEQNDEEKLKVQSENHCEQDKNDLRHGNKPCISEARVLIVSSAANHNGNTSIKTVCNQPVSVGSSGQQSQEMSAECQKNIHNATFQHILKDRLLRIPISTGQPGDMAAKVIDADSESTFSTEASQVSASTHDGTLNLSSPSTITEVAALSDLLYTGTNQMTNTKTYTVLERSSLSVERQHEATLTTQTVTTSSSRSGTSFHIAAPGSDRTYSEAFTGAMTTAVLTTRVTTASDTPSSQPLVAHHCLMPVSQAKRQLKLIPQTVLEHMSDNDESVEGTIGSETKGHFGQDHKMYTSNSPINENWGNSNSGTHVNVQQSYKSDMEYSSDSEDRLVVDNDSRTGDAVPGEESSEEEQSQDGVIKSEACVTPTQNKVAHNIVGNMMSGMTTSSSTSSEFRCESDSFPSSRCSSLPIHLVSRAAESSSAQHQMVIPSVVTELVPVAEHTDDFRSSPVTHAKKKELKSLPADFKLPVKRNSFNFSADESLLKMNKPNTGLCLQTVRVQDSPLQVENRDKFAETFGQAKTVMARLKDVVAGSEGSQRFQHFRPSSLDTADRRDKPEHYRVTDSEAKIKKEKSAPAESPDVNKDSLTSEQQVNAVIKRYNLANSPEKREVSVKDMRRVIPQLIMCLYSKEDHHARKVKGLWERKPDKWPSDIPYCDPNNSNRGGDSMGKPKKETLHKMFDYLISQYLQKMHAKERTSLQTPASTPHYLANYAVSSQQMSPLNPSSSYLPKGGSFPTTTDSSLTTVAKIDFRPSFDKAISSIPATDDQKRTSSCMKTKSLPADTLMSSVFKSNPQPPVKRQKTNFDEEEKIKCNVTYRNQLPTVVDMHSPVKTNEESDINHLSYSPVHEPASLNVQNSVCVTTGAKLVSSLPKDLLGAGGLYHSERCSSLPNVALMMSRQNMVIGSDQLRPMPAGSAVPLPTADPPSMSSLQPSAMNDSPTKSSAVNVQVPSMLTLPLVSGVPQFLTAQAIPGVPIIPLADLTLYQNSSSLLSGQQPFYTDKKPSVSPVPPHESPKLEQFTNQSAAKSTPTREYMPNIEKQEVQSCLSSQTETSSGLSPPPSQLPDVQTSSGSHDGQTTDDLAETRKNSQMGLCREKKVNEDVKFKKDERLRQTQNADLQAASAILMLSETPVVSSSEMTAKREHMTKSAVVADGSNNPEMKVECLSINNDFHSPPGSSLTSNLYQINASASQKEMVPVTSLSNTGFGTQNIYMPILNQPTSSVQCSTQNALSLQFTSLPQAMSSNINLTSHAEVISNIPASGLPATSNIYLSNKMSASCLESAVKVSSDNLISKSGPSHSQMVSPCVTSATAVVTSSSSHIHEVKLPCMTSTVSDSCSSVLVTSPYAPTDLIRKRQLSPLSQSQRSPGESYTGPQQGESSCDSPLSLVVPHRDIDVKEEQTSDVITEEPFDPIQETMDRIQKKLLLVENLHHAKKFGGRDLSLLLLVLDLLKQKQNCLDKHVQTDFILTCHRLEATFDVAIIDRQIPDSLRQDWRDFQEKTYFEVNRRRSNIKPPMEAHVFRLSTSQ